MKQAVTKVISSNLEQNRSRNFNRQELRILKLSSGPKNTPLKYTTLLIIK